MNDGPKLERSLFTAFECTDENWIKSQGNH